MVRVPPLPAICHLPSVAATDHPCVDDRIACAQSQQANSKPSLSGVRIKVRKGTAKASAKHEPEGAPLLFSLASLLRPKPETVFRDQVYKFLETAPENDFDAVTNKLVTAGSTLEFNKYADALFEILIVGALLAPGGNLLLEDTQPSPFSIARASEPVKVDEIAKYVEVFNKLIRRCVSFSRVWWWGVVLMSGGIDTSICSRLTYILISIISHV